MGTGTKAFGVLLLIGAGVAAYNPGIGITLPIIGTKVGEIKLIQPPMNYYVAGGLGITGIALLIWG